MRDHAPPMKDQTKIWTITWSTYSFMPPSGMTGPAARSTTRVKPAARPSVTSAPPCQDAARSHEHHDDEDDERDDVAHLGGPHDAGDRDDLAHDERGDEGADHVPEAAQHADHERERAELIAEERVHGVLEGQERAGEARHEAADRGGHEGDAAGGRGPQAPRPP